MRLRGNVVLVNRPTRWGYVVDAVIPLSKVVILKMPDLTRQGKVALSMLRDFTHRLEGDGYRVLIIPKRDMSIEQINAFCDRITVEPALAAA
ncbi:MAG: hypothetical protein WB392_08910 [Methanotrichaceae archaeon]